MAIAERLELRAEEARVRAEAGQQDDRAGIHWPWASE
jgi:hypothetical protein